MLADPAAIDNPFYRSGARSACCCRWSMLATAADRDREPGRDHRRLFADHQAIQLGMLPRLAILHTSAAHAGQIYIPRVTTGAAGRRAAAGRDVPAPRARSPRPTASRSPPPWWSTALLAFIVVWKLWQLATLWQAALLIVPLVVVDVDLLLRQSAQAARGRLGAAACSARRWCC